MTWTRGPVSLAPAVTDPYFSSVVLLLHGEGTPTVAPDAPVDTIIDSSSYAHVPSVVSGGTIISNTQVLCGDTSLFISGSGRIQYDDASEFEFGSSDFCIEAKVRFESDAGGSRAFIAGKSSTAGTDSDTSFLLERDSSGKLHAFCISTGSPTVFGEITGTTTLVQDTNYHVAYCRIGTDFYLWLDGASEGTASSSSTVRDVSYDIAIGALGEFVGFSANAYFDEVRITIGNGRYSTSFTPSTDPFPDA